MPLGIPSLPNPLKSLTKAVESVTSAIPSPSLSDVWSATKDVTGEAYGAFESVQKAASNTPVPILSQAKALVEDPMNFLTYEKGRPDYLTWTEAREGTQAASKQYLPGVAGDIGAGIAGIAIDPLTIIGAGIRTPTVAMEGLPLLGRSAARTAGLGAELFGGGGAGLRNYAAGTLGAGVGMGLVDSAGLEDEWWASLAGSLVGGTAGGGVDTGLTWRSMKQRSMEAQRIWKDTQDYMRQEAAFDEAVERSGVEPDASGAGAEPISNEASARSERQILGAMAEVRNAPNDPENRSVSIQLGADSYSIQWDQSAQSYVIFRNGGAIDEGDADYVERLLLDAAGGSSGPLRLSRQGDWGEPDWSGPEMDAVEMARVDRNLGGPRRGQWMPEENQWEPDDPYLDGPQTNPDYVDWEARLSSMAPGESLPVDIPNWSVRRHTNGRGFSIESAPDGAVIQSFDTIDDVLSYLDEVTTGYPSPPRDPNAEARRSFTEQATEATRRWFQRRLEEEGEIRGPDWVVETVPGIEYGQYRVFTGYDPSTDTYRDTRIASLEEAMEIASASPDAPVSPQQRVNADLIRQNVDAAIDMARRNGEALVGIGDREFGILRRGGEYALMEGLTEYMVGDLDMIRTVLQGEVNQFTGRSRFDANRPARPPTTPDRRIADTGYLVAQDGRYIVHNPLRESGDDRPYYVYDDFEGGHATTRTAYPTLEAAMEAAPLRDNWEDAPYQYPPRYMRADGGIEDIYGGRVYNHGPHELHIEPPYRSSVSGGWTTSVSFTTSGRNYTSHIPGPAGEIRDLADMIATLVRYSNEYDNIRIEAVAADQRRFVAYTKTAFDGVPYGGRQVVFNPEKARKTLEKLERARRQQGRNSSLPGAAGIWGTSPEPLDPAVAELLGLWEPEPGLVIDSTELGVAEGSPDFIDVNAYAQRDMESLLKMTDEELESAYKQAARDVYDQMDTVDRIAEAGHPVGEEEFPGFEQTPRGKLQRSINDYRQIAAERGRRDPAKSLPGRIQDQFTRILHEETGATGPDLLGIMPRRSGGLQLPRGGTGNHPAVAGNRLVAPLRALGDAVNDVITSRSVAARVAKVLGASPNATLTTPVGRASVGYLIQRTSIEDLVQIALSGMDVYAPSWGRGTTPFAINAEGTIANLKVAPGLPDNLSRNWNDVFSRPGDYALSDRQRNYIRAAHRVLREMQEYAEAQGIDPLPKRDAAEGWVWVPRQTKGVGEIDLTGSASSPRLHRHYETAQEGIAAGVRYEESPRATIELYLKVAYEEILERQLRDYLIKYSVTPKQIIAGLSPEVWTRYKDATKRYLKAKQRSAAVSVSRDVNAAEREIRQHLADERQGLWATARDLRHTANDLVDTMVGLRPDVTHRLSELRSENDRAWSVARGTIDIIARGGSLDADGKRIIRDALRASRQWSDAIHSATNTEVREAIRDRIVTQQDKLGDLREHIDVLEDFLSPPEHLRDILAGKRRAARVELDAATAEHKQARAAYSFAIKQARATKYLPGSFLGQTEERIPMRTIKDVTKRDIPGWHDHYFPKEDAEALARAFDVFGGETAMNPLWRVPQILSDYIRFLSATLDFAAPFIQGLPLLANDPVAWSKVVLRNFQAFFDPHVQSRYIQQNLAVFQEMAQYGVPVGNNEFMSALRAGQGVSLLAPLHHFGAPGDEVRRLLRIGGKQSFGRFQSSYDMTLTVMRAELWRNLKPHWKDGDLSGLARHIRNMTGGLDSRALGVGPRQRSLEGFFLAFAPRLLRSTASLFLDATQGGTRGYAARKALSQYAAIAVMAYTLVGLASGKDWDEIEQGFDPLGGKRFLSYQVGDQWIGVGGQVRSISQFLYSMGAPIWEAAERTAEGDPRAALREFKPYITLTTPDAHFDNPIIRGWEGRAAVGLRLTYGAIDALTNGRAQMLPFEAIEGPMDYIEMIGTDLIPMWLGSALEFSEADLGADAPLGERLRNIPRQLQRWGVAGEFAVAARVSPLTPREEIDKAVVERYGKSFIAADGRTVIDFHPVGAVKDGQPDGPYAQLQQNRPELAEEIRLQVDRQPTSDVGKASQRLRDETDAKLKVYEDFYLSGGYLKEPDAVPLPEKFKQLTEERLAHRGAILVAFEKDIEGFDKTQGDKDLDGYYGKIVLTADGMVNWPETIAQRESFLSSLPAQRRAWMEEMLDVFEARRSPLQQAFRADMNRLRASNYPFGTKATTDFQKVHPDADLTMWRWYGGALQTVDAVEAALREQADSPMPIRLDSFGRRVDKDLAFWDVVKTDFKWYLSLDSDQRLAALRKYPDINAALVYWGQSRKLHTSQAAQYLDDYMKAQRWEWWSGTGLGESLIWYYGLTDKQKPEARVKYPDIDAALMLFNEHQFEDTDIVFATEASRREFERMTGRNTSKYPTSPVPLFVED